MGIEGHAVVSLQAGTANTSNTSCSGPATQQVLAETVLNESVNERGSEKPATESWAFHGPSPPTQHWAPFRDLEVAPICRGLFIVHLLCPRYCKSQELGRSSRSICGAHLSVTGVQGHRQRGFPQVAFQVVFRAREEAGWECEGAEERAEGTAGGIADRRAYWAEGLAQANVLSANALSGMGEQQGGQGGLGRENPGRGAQALQGLVAMGKETLWRVLSRAMNRA